MAAAKFGYTGKTVAWRSVTTFEEDEYFDYYQSHRPEGEGEGEAALPAESEP